MTKDYKSIVQKYRDWQLKPGKYTVEEVIGEILSDIEEGINYPKVDLNAVYERQHANGYTTSISEEQWGVHRTHCCIVHGCKYMDDDCPVVLGIIKQDYECEFCKDDEND